MYLLIRTRSTFLGLYLKEVNVQYKKIWTYMKDICWDYFQILCIAIFCVLPMWCDTVPLSNLSLFFPLHTFITVNTYSLKYAQYGCAIFYSTLHLISFVFPCCSWWLILCMTLTMLCWSIVLSKTRLRCCCEDIFQMWLTFKSVESE